MLVSMLNHLSTLIEYYQLIESHRVIVASVWRRVGALADIMLNILVPRLSNIQRLRAQTQVRVGVYAVDDQRYTNMNIWYISDEMTQ